MIRLTRGLHMRTIKAILIITFVIVASFFITINTPSLSNGSATIIKDDFLLSFLGMFAGVTIAIITFLYSNIEKIRNAISKGKSKEKIPVFEIQISHLFSELKHDTVFILLSLLGCFALIILRDIRLSWLCITNKFITKQQVISSFELSFVLLTFVSLIDIMGSLFNLVKISSLVQIEK